jgi:hypothetical protein
LNQAPARLWAQELGMRPEGEKHRLTRVLDGAHALGFSPHQSRRMRTAQDDVTETHPPVFLLS